MKRKFTKAREANRASAFRKTGSYGTPSAKRSALRSKPKAKTFGYQVIRIQRVSLKDKTTQFKVPIFKYIKHAKMRVQTI